MLQQIKILTGLELCNYCGWNVFRHTGDSMAKKKSIAMAVAYGLVFIILIGYVCGLCFGLAMLGADSVIPAYLIGIASIVTLMLSIFKAGGIIFRKQGYDVLTAMPVSRWAVVISRFLHLYVDNLLAMLLIMLPGMLIYGTLVRPGMGFYIVGILATFITPLLPVAIASAVGALIIGISSRMKHKALVEAGLSVLLVVIVLFTTAKLPTGEEEFTTEILRNMADMVTEAIGNLYPPAIWLGNAMVEENWGTLGTVAGGFLLLTGIVVVMIGMNFHGICRRLFGTSAKHNYQMRHLQEGSVMRALVVREARRYFASGVYVSNTIIGPILAVALSAGLLFVDLESMTASIPMQLNVRAAIPFAVAAVFAMMNTTSVSISMEGKEVWILKSLPLTRKNILDSKILFNLCLFVPFYIISVVLMMIALKPDMLEILGLIGIPAIVLVFSCVFGITANLLFPKLEWDKEVVVVKQSASALFGGLGGTLIVVICTLLVLLLPKRYGNMVSVVISVLLAGATVVLYQKNNQESAE